MSILPLSVRTAPRSSAWPLRVVLCLGVALLIASLPGVTQAQEDTVVDEIVAVVGSDILLRSEVDGLVYNYVQQSEVPYTDELWSDALNQLIDQRVLAIHAQRDTTITISDEQVTQSLDQRIQQLTAQMGGAARVEEVYGKSIVELRAEFREDLRDQLLADQLRARKMRTIKATPTEVREWFADVPVDSLPDVPTVVRLSHIVRFPEPSQQAVDDAREIVSTIRDSVLTGTSSLESMARRFSEDPGSAPDGGRIADINLSDLVPEFAAVASRLRLGQLSDVFRTPFGFHILRVNERSGETVDFNHVLITIDESSADPAPTLEYLAAVRDSVVTMDRSFARLARVHSEEEFSSQQGGRVLDPRSQQRDLVLEALGPTWQRTIRTLEVGDVSEPTNVVLLDGQEGYHIVRLDRYDEAHRMSLATDYERIEQFVLQEKQGEVMRDWLDDLRRSVYIDLRGKAQRLSIAATGD